MHQKRILDACCGGRMFWFDKKNPDVEFCDNRILNTNFCDGRSFQIEPDTVADFTALPFPDNTFWHVVFDPPHFTAAGSTSWMAKKYGVLPKEWRELLHDGFAELMRVLKPNGTLVFKWSEYQIPVCEVLKAIGQMPLYGHKSGKRQKTHWMCFIKNAAPQPSADNALAPIWKDGKSVVRSTFVNGHEVISEHRLAGWACPVCESFVWEKFVPIWSMDTPNNHQKCNFCPRCGQRMDWRTVEGGADHA